MTDLVRRTLLNIDNTLLLDVKVIAENLEVGLLPARVAAGLTGPFGLLGLILASAGIYALVAFTVGQRRKEIGIRMAVGAGKGAVLRMILRKGMVLAVAGMAVGFVFSLGVSQLMRSFLIGIAPADPVTFVFAAIVIVAVAAMASWIPARRAAQIDPMETLRNE
jgi:ABC-type antimicrobial peptide transport system permease subunit